MCTSKSGWQTPARHQCYSKDYEVCLVQVLYKRNYERITICFDYSLLENIDLFINEQFILNYEKFEPQNLVFY